MKLKINNIDERLLELRDFIDHNTCITENLVRKIHDSLWVDKLPSNWGEKRKTKHINKNLVYYAINCIKLKYIKNNYTASFKEGFVYVLTHPKFPNYFKIGSTIDIHDRLSSYNVGCPLREYKILLYYPSQNRLEDERKLHNYFNFHSQSGEWFFKEPLTRRWIKEEIEKCSGLQFIGNRY